MNLFSTFLAFNIKRLLFLIVLLFSITSISQAQCVDASITSYTEGFNNNIGAWTQSTTDDFNWTFESGQTGSSNTGPNAPFEGSHYLYTESSSPNSPSKKAVITSPCFDLTGLTTPVFVFYYHMYGATMGSLKLEISVNGGTTWNNIWSMSGNKGNQWNQANINLISYATNTNVQLRFTGTTGTSFTSDIALDALYLGNLSPEINIQGNGIDIINGDNLPSTSDNTAFGSICGSRSKTHTFTIQNTGVGTLNLTGTPIVAISGSSDFSISIQPSANTIAMGANLTFNVTYTPSLTGLQVATISVSSNDTDENPYTFGVSGSYTVDVTPPVIAVPTNIVTNASAGSCGAMVNYKVCTTDNCDIVASNVVLKFTGPDVFGTPYIEQGMTITSPTHVDAPWSVGCGDGRGLLIHSGDLSNWSYNNGTPINLISFEACTTNMMFISPTGATFSPSTTGVVTFPNTPDWNCITSFVWKNTGGGNASLDNFTFNSTSAIATQTSGLPSGSIFPIGTTINTFTYTDLSGNTATESFTVTVNDTQRPVLTAQADFTRNANIGNCTFTNPATVGNIPNGTAADNCAVASYSYVLTGATTGTVTTLVNQIFNIGVTTVTWTATDASGNVSANDVFTVTVEDNQLPTLTAQADFTRNADAGNCNFVNTNIPNGVASDNCSVASYQYILSGATTATVTTLVNQVFNSGTTTITWTATDASGNISASDVFTVTINETQLPTLTAQADFTRNADAGVCSFTNTNIPNGVATDNCTIASYQYVLTGATIGTVTTLTNQVFNVGVTTITWTATDISGNISANDVFTVTVLDNQLPTITCPANIIVSSTGSCSSIVTYNLPTATDNCGIASIVQIAGLPSGSSFPNTTTTNTFQVTDVNGNTTSCSFEVTVNIRPELVYSALGFSEIYPTTSGILGNTISINSSSCDIFAGANGEDFVTTGKVTVSNIPNGLTASIIKVSNTELAFRLNGYAINNNRVDDIDNLTVIFNDAAFVGVTAANVITSTKTDLVIRFLEGVPLYLWATGLSTSEVKLYWDENTGYEGFHLYRGNLRIATLPSTAIHYIDENLDADTFYQYHIYGLVNGIEMEISRTNEWTYPLAPRLISINPVCESGQAQVTLKSSAFFYNVYADSTSETILMTSNGDETFLLPFISQTTTFYVSVIGNDPHTLKESARTPVRVESKIGFDAIIEGENIQVSCENTLELAAQAIQGATYTWYLNGHNLGIHAPTMTANYSGNYQVRIQRGVCSFISEKVIVKLNQNPVAKIQEQNGTRFCQNGILNAISAGQNVSYEWILNNVVIGNNQSQEVTQAGNYTLIITTEQDCQASTSIEVMVTDITQSPILETSETTICPNSETIISIQNAESGVTYQWFRNGRNIRQTGNSISTSIKGKYQVRVISNENTACNSISNEIEINHFEMLPIYLRISEDKKALFVEDANNSQSEIASVEWYFEGELKADLGSNFEIIPTENGYYSAKITNQNGCIIQTRTVYFSVPKIPVITGEEDVKMDLFKIYPNPSNTGIFNIHFGTILLEDIQITVFDGIGREIYTTTFKKGSQDFKINLQNNPIGMYMIRFNQNNSVYSKQIIID